MCRYSGVLARAVAGAILVSSVAGAGWAHEPSVSIWNHVAIGKAEQQVSSGSEYIFVLNAPEYVEGVFSAIEPINIDLFEVIAASRTSADAGANDCFRFAFHGLFYFHREVAGFNCLPSDLGAIPIRGCLTGIFKLDAEYSVIQAGTDPLFYRQRTAIDNDISPKLFLGGIFSNVGLSSSLFKRANYEPDADDRHDEGYKAEHSGRHQHSESPKSHVLLGLQILFGALVFACCLYGFTNTLREGRSIEPGAAAIYAVLNAFGMAGGVILAASTMLG